VTIHEKTDLQIRTRDIRIAELKAELDELKTKFAESELSMLSRIAIICKENAILWKALQPFVRFADALSREPNWMPDGCPVVIDPTTRDRRLTVGDFRQAAALVRTQEKP
jgi:hypothetical protein